MRITHLLPLVPRRLLRLQCTKASLFFVCVCACKLIVSRFPFTLDLMAKRGSVHSYLFLLCLLYAQGTRPPVSRVCV